MWISHQLIRTNEFALQVSRLSQKSFRSKCVLEFYSSPWIECEWKNYTDTSHPNFIPFFRKCGLWFKWTISSTQCEWRKSAICGRFLFVCRGKWRTVENFPKIRYRRSASGRIDMQNESCRNNIDYTITAMTGICNCRLWNTGASNITANNSTRMRFFWFD